MSIVAIIKCDGEGCRKSKVMQSFNELQALEYEYPDGWVRDCDDDTDYCHECFEKIKATDTDGEGNFHLTF